MLTENEIRRRLEDFQKAARDAGIKVTPQRLFILRIVLSRDTHPGVEEIYQELHETMPTISLDTVYRTLRMLTDLGFITTVDHSQGLHRFDSNRDLHHHFCCIRCSMIRDFSKEELNRLEIPQEAREYGRAISLQVLVKGICQECLEKELKKHKKE